MRWLLLLVVSLVACTDDGGSGLGGSTRTVRQELQLPLPSLALPCWSAPLADADAVAPGLQAECAAEIHTTTTDTALVRCAPGATAPCFTLVEDTNLCPEVGVYTKLDNLDGSAGTASLECLGKDAP